MIRTLRLGGAPIGVEIDGDVLRVVQAHSAGVVESVAMPRRPGEAAEEGWPGPLEIARLGDVLARRRFRGRALVLSMPQEACGFEDADGSAIGAPHDLSLAGSPPGGAILVSTPVQAGGGRVERLFVRGCARAPLEAACVAFAAAGWRVVGVRTRADALAANTPKAAVAWLDFCVDAASPTQAVPRTRATLVVCEGGVPLYGRPIQTALPEKLSSASPAVAEALAAEMLPGIKQARTRCAAEAISQLRISGGRSSGPAEDSMLRHFTQRLADRLDLTASAAAGPDDLALALGLPLRPDVDLLPPSSRASRRERVALRAALGATLGYAALVAVLLALWSSAGGPDAADAASPEQTQAQMADIEAQTLAATAGALAQERRIGELRSAVAAADAAADRPDWRLLLGRLARDAAGKVHFREVEVSTTPSGAATVKVSGEAPNPRAAWDFALALESGELFKRVDLARTHRADARPESAVLFEVQLLLAPLAAETLWKGSAVSPGPSGAAEATP